MAVKKASAKKASTKKASAKKNDTLSAADTARLMGLPAAYDARPTQPVRDMEQEAKDLGVAFTKLGKKLISHGGIDKNAGKELAARAKWLSTAERVWTSQREFAVKADIKTLRKQSTEAKRLAMAALRHFKRGDADIQVRLDAIAEGAGDVDLADDLNKLADLIDANLKALKTPEIKATTSATMRTLASRLSDAVTERNTDVEASDAMKLRNRAYWHLHELVTAIQSAGRYVYRDDPAALKHFRTLRNR